MPAKSKPSSRANAWFLLAGAVCLAQSASTLAEDSISGRWKLTVTQEGASRDYYLELVSKGTSVSGTFVSPRSGRYAFEGGSFAEGKLSLSVNRDLSGKIGVYLIEAAAAPEGKFEGKLTVDGKPSGTIVLVRDGSPIAGKWDVISKTKEGRTHESTLEVLDEGGTLKAKSVSRLGEIAVKSIQFDGVALSIEMDLPLDGNQVPFAISAKLAGSNRFEGTWRAKEADFSGEWSATRAGPEAAPAPLPAPAPVVEVPSAFAGKWYGVAQRLDGAREAFTLAFEVAEGKLAAVATVKQGEVRLPQVKLEGTSFELELPWNEDGTTVELKLTGKLEDGVLRGRWTAATGESGEWMAQRPVTL
jgi:hypothetical protein